MSLADVIRSALADVEPASVPLVVIAADEPGADVSTPLLDGDLCTSVVRTVLADNGLMNAVPFGVVTDGPDPIAVTRALMAADELPCALMVILDGPTAILLR